jgi:TRAP-type C4-dicarboxylate transport system permease small subunit
MLAQVNLQPTSGEFQALGGYTFGDIVGGLINIVLLIAAVIFFFILVWGGIRWITSGGDKANTEAARNQITAALVGLVIVFAAWAILQLIEAFFGITLLGDLSIPSIQ